MAYPSIPKFRKHLEKINHILESVYQTFLCAKSLLQLVVNFDTKLPSQCQCIAAMFRNIDGRVPSECIFASIVSHLFLAHLSRQAHKVSL